MRTRLPLSSASVRSEMERLGMTTAVGGTVILGGHLPGSRAAMSSRRFSTYLRSASYHNRQFNYSPHKTIGGNTAYLDDGLRGSSHRSDRGSSSNSSNGFDRGLYLSRVIFLIRRIVPFRTSGDRSGRLGRKHTQQGFEGRQKELDERLNKTNNLYVGMVRVRLKYFYYGCILTFNNSFRRGSDRLSGLKRKGTLGRQTYVGKMLSCVMGNRFIR